MRCCLICLSRPQVPKSKNPTQLRVGLHVGSLSVSRKNHLYVVVLSSPTKSFNNGVKFGTIFYISKFIFKKKFTFFLAG